MVTEAWVRVSPIPGRPAAGYLSIKNIGSQAERLLAAASPEAERVTLHRTENANGIKSMRRLDYIEIEADTSFALRPGEHHLMLMNTADDLASRNEIRIRLRFEGAGWIEVEAEVRAFGSRQGRE